MTGPASLAGGGPGRPFARRGGRGGVAQPDAAQAARGAHRRRPPRSSATRAYFARRLGIAESVRRAMQERFERKLGLRWSEFELPQSVARMRAAALVIHDADDDEVHVRERARARARLARRALRSHPGPRPSRHPARSRRGPRRGRFHRRSRGLRARLRSAASRSAFGAPAPSSEELSMRKHIPPEHSARVLAIALATWGAVVAWRGCVRSASRESRPTELAAPGDLRDRLRAGDLPSRRGAARASSSTPRAASSRPRRSPPTWRSSSP